MHSHDACDGEPKDASGKANLPCLDDFRSGLCATRHDFVMLTDHNDSFGSTEFPATLLYDAAKGDVLLERAGGPVASWLACPDGSTPLILAGTETAFMPVGIERHVAKTHSEREAVYGAETPEAIEQLKKLGAVVLLQHTEDWTVEQLGELPIDGFEMYNLHANTFLGAGAVIQLIQRMNEPELMPYSDLVLLPIVSEDKRYLERWGSVLAAGKKRVHDHGLDCHRNSFKDLLPDGERIDSYRRMMGWFSNHLLVEPSADGGFDDLALKSTLWHQAGLRCVRGAGLPRGLRLPRRGGRRGHRDGRRRGRSAAPVLHARLPAAEAALARSVPIWWCACFAPGSAAGTWCTRRPRSGTPRQPAGRISRRSADEAASPREVPGQLRRARREGLRLDLLERHLREVTLRPSRGKRPSKQVMVRGAFAEERRARSGRSGVPSRMPSRSSQSGSAPGESAWSPLCKRSIT